MPRLALTFLVACLLLTACSPTVILLTDETEPAPTSVPTLRPPSVTRIAGPTPVPGTKLGASPDDLRGVTVSLWHGLDGESGALLAQMASEFSQSNSWGVQVQVVAQKNLTLLTQAVEAAMSGPEHPDLALALPEYALAWDAQGWVTDLTPYVADSKVGLSAEEIDDIPPAFWEQGQAGARRLSVPALRAARFMFYNVSFAKELGFTAPPRSADEFREQACAANASWKTDADETNDFLGGWVLDNRVLDIDASWTAYAWTRAMGGEIYVDGQYKFSTPENQSALGFLAELRNDDCVFPSAILQKYYEDHGRMQNFLAAPNAEALVNRESLFVAGSLQSLHDQRVAFGASPDQWTVIPFPGATPSIVAYGPDYVALKSTEARQLAAWLFMRWMLSPENQARWQRATGLFPMRTSAVDLLENIRNANPQWTAAFDLLPQARAYPQSAAWPKARLVLGDGFLHIFQLNPSAADVTLTLQEMDAVVQDLLQ